MKKYDSILFKIPILKQLLDFEGYFILGKLILYRQKIEEVDKYTDLCIDEYLLNIEKLGLMKYYKVYLKEYFINRFRGFGADSRHLISLTMEEKQQAMDKLPDPVFANSEEFLGMGTYE